SKDYEKTDAELIEEIHNIAYAEEDRLLKETYDVYDINDLDFNTELIEDIIIEDMQIYQKSGFIRTKEYLKLRKKLQKIREFKKSTLENENEYKLELREAITYFSQKYPYKFITEESIQKICNKYNLLFGSSNIYVGGIPDKNVNHIKNFKI